MTTLNDYIHTHQTGDPDETVAAVFDAMALPEKWRSMFYRVVRDECRRQSRSFVRDMENGQTGHDTNDCPAVSMSRAAYIAERFWNGTRYVVWGEATVDDHLARIAFQSLLRDGINANIEHHRTAIKDIEDAGVTCLNEIPVAA